MFSQKPAGLMSQEDDLSKLIGKMHDAYQSGNLQVWDEIISADAVVYLNNIKMDYKTMRAAFQSHQAIFSNIKIEDIVCTIVELNITARGLNDHITASYGLHC